MQSRQVQAGVALARGTATVWFAILNGERVCAFVVPVPGQTFTLEELSGFLLNVQQIATYKVPERLEFIDELPQTKTGKYQKKSLRERIKMILKSEGNFYGDD